MRDKRSLSFTWIKGQASKRSSMVNMNPHERLEDEEEDMTNESEGTSSSSWGIQRGNSGSRLRQLTSFIKIGNLSSGGGDYSSIQEEDEDENREAWHKVREENVPLEEDEDQEGEVEVRMDLETPDVLRVKARGKATAAAPAAVVPFQPVENKEEGEEPSSSAASMSLSKRLNKTVQGMKVSIGNFSQKFRKSTRRRYRMGAATPGSTKSVKPSPATRKILGRTPTKLYSPFGIDSPITMKTPKRLGDRPSTPRMPRKSIVSGLVYSPSNNFRQELDEARRGMQEFHLLSRDITRRSVRF